MVEEADSVNETPDYTNAEISSCLERVDAGDEVAARELVRAMTPLVMKIIRSHLPPRESEHDLAQKIFIKMFQNLGQYSARVPFAHWLSRIAVNTCLSQISSEKRRPELRWSDLSPEQAQVVSNLAANVDELDPADAAASRDLVERLLERLKPAERLLMTLLYLEGRSMAEISALTGWSLPVIKIRAFRTRARLRTQFSRLREELP